MHIELKSEHFFPCSYFYRQSLRAFFKHIFFVIFTCPLSLSEFFFMTILNRCANDNDERTLLVASVVGKAITYFPWNKIQVHVPPYSLNNFPNILQNVTKYIKKKRLEFTIKLLN